MNVGESTNLLDLNRAAMGSFLTSLGEPSAKASLLLRWLHQRRTIDFQYMQDINCRLRKKLADCAAITVPRLLREHEANDGTRKWLLGLSDGNAIETVYMPEENRATLCISSQVGCSLNCRFCATAQAGFNRNLTTAEIIGQLWFALSQVPYITNVVMMGMGEPLLNYDAVLRALDLMLDDHAYGLSKHRVTLSTAGLVPALQRLRNDSPVSLAVSLHAPNNALRSQLVPLNKKYPLEALIPVCRDYFPIHSKQKILFEYVMLDQVNDQIEHAQQLVVLLAGIRCKVNLIPFNAYPGAPYRCATKEAINEFQQYLIAAGIPTWVRRTRGEDIDGACGQLAGWFFDRTGRKKRIILQ